MRRRASRLKETVMRIHAFSLSALVCLSAMGCSAGAAPEDTTTSSSSALLNTRWGGFATPNEFCLISYRDANGVAKPLSPLTLIGCNGTDGERFNLNFHSDGDIVAATNTGLCVDVNFADYDTGKVQLAGCNQTGAQKWWYGHGHIRSTGAALAGKSKCLQADRLENYTNIRLANCDDNNDAQYFIPFGMPLTIESGVTTGGGLLTQHYCFQPHNGVAAAGTDVEIRECNTNSPQTFTYTEANEIKFGGLCLDLYYADTNAGIVKLQQCNGTAAQKWPYIHGGQFVSGVDQGYCLDVYYAQPDGKVHLTTCNQTVAQAWNTYISY
jgi:hypothetical protein